MLHRRWSSWEDCRLECVVYRTFQTLHPEDCYLSGLLQKCQTCDPGHYLIKQKYLIQENKTFKKHCHAEIMNFCLISVISVNATKYTTKLDKNIL